MSEVFHPLRIFVVDDELSVALTLVRILRFGGYDATPFTDSNDALFAARRTPPGLLLAETDMPARSGIELAAAMRQSSPDCKVLLMSWDLRHNDLRDSGRVAGFEFDVLEKPVRMAELLRKVSLLLHPAKPPQSVPNPALNRCIA